MTGLEGITIGSNEFYYGVNDKEPEIYMAGRVRIATPEEREKARAEIIKKFDAACWMFDHKADAEA